MDEKEIQNNTKNNLKTIHTYTSDMADAVRENEMSVIKIALAEKEKREREEIYQEASGSGVNKFFWVLGGIIFIAGSLVGGYFLYQKNKSASIAPEVKIRTEALISYDEEVALDTSNINTDIELGTLIKEETKKPLAKGQIKSILLQEKVGEVETPISIEKFLTLFDLDAPQALVRTFDTDYMIGSYVAKSTTTTNAEGEEQVVAETHPFLIFKIKDYNQAYASMLAWEDLLLNDMFVLFDTDVAGERSVLFDKPWKDIILDNKDARILYDKDGKDILFYIFTSKDTLLITDSKQAIKEVTARLRAKETKPI